MFRKNDSTAAPRHRNNNNASAFWRDLCQFAPQLTIGKPTAIGVYHYSFKMYLYGLIKGGKPFNPSTDIPDLSGKVILITGGKAEQCFLSFAPKYFLEP